jgi:hypothetical protein
VALVTIATSATTVAAFPSPVTAGYLDHEALVRAAEDLAQSDERCSLTVIGSSRQGRAIVMLTLGDPPDPDSAKPAILVTAGLDGRHLVGTETALRAARRLLDADDETLLDRYGRWYLADRDPTWWRRNALVVLGNTGDPGDERTRTTLERYGAHPSEVLREHAVWAAERLGLEPVPTNPSTA